MRVSRDAIFSSALATSFRWVSRVGGDWCLAEDDRELFGRVNARIRCGKRSYTSKSRYICELTRLSSSLKRRERNAHRGQSEKKGAPRVGDCPTNTFLFPTRSTNSLSQRAQTHPRENAPRFVLVRVFPPRLQRRRDRLLESASSTRRVQTPPEERRRVERDESPRHRRPRSRSRSERPIRSIWEYLAPAKSNPE